MLPAILTFLAVYAVSFWAIGRNALVSALVAAVAAFVAFGLLGGRI